MYLSQKKKKKKKKLQQYLTDYSTWHNWHDLPDSRDFPAACTLDFDNHSKSEALEVSSCVGHPLPILEVERWEFYMESKQGSFHLCWKSRGGNIVPNKNRMEIKSCVDSLKPGLHLNANRVRMWYGKTMRMFDVDVLPKRGKQHSAVRQMFGEQPNAICQLLVLQRELTYDSFRCTWFIFLRSVKKK